MKAIHIRFRPEGTGDDDITSRRFKEQCALSTYGVEEKIDLTPEESDPRASDFDEVNTATISRILTC